MSGPATKLYEALQEFRTVPEGLAIGEAQRHYHAMDVLESITPAMLEAMDAAADVASAVIRPDASATVSQGLLTLRLRVGRELHVEVVMLAAVEGAVLQALLEREVKRRKERGHE